MNPRRFSGLIRILCAAGLLFSPGTAWAASWEWSALPGRERVDVRLDTSAKKPTASRTGRTEIVLDLGQSAQTVKHIGKRGSGLVAKVTPSGNFLVLTLRDPAFGYVVSRPGTRRIRVDVFPDPLGARWRASGRPAPQSQPADSGTSAPSTSVPSTSAKKGKEVSGPPPVAVGKASAPIGRTEEAKGADKTSPGTMVAGDPRASGSTPFSDGRGIVPAGRPQGNSTVSSVPFVAPASPAVPEKRVLPPPSTAALEQMTSRIEKIPVQEPSATAGATPQQSPAVADPAPATRMVSGDNATAGSSSSSEPVRFSPPEGARGYVSGHELRGTVNPKGRDAWPENEALNSLALGKQALRASAARSGAAPGGPRPSVPAQLSPEKSPASGEDVYVPGTRQPVDPPPSAEAPVQRPVIYVDENGNEVPKPPDVPALLEESQKYLNTLQFANARAILEQLKAQVLTPEQRERVLYMLSDALDGLYKERRLEGFEPISAATNEAMNFNLDSPRVPQAMYRLGTLNLEVGNQQDAAAYYGALRQKYPGDPDVPTAYVQLGRDQLKKQQYAEAVQSFQVVLDEYPESKSVRDAARYMAEALYRQGHYDRSRILVDFVDRRWPRIYLEDPGYLPMVADIYEKTGHDSEALQTYWTYYNLLPDNPDNDKNLLAIGSIYLKMGLKKAARDVFDELLRKFPKGSSAPLAVLRSGEEGIYDGNPTLDELFSLFNRPSTGSPEAAYHNILEKYPDSPQAEMAAIRLAAMRYWSKDTDEAMQAAADFQAAYPVSVYSGRADEIILRGFKRELGLALEEENYERILSLWERYSRIPAAYPHPDDDLQVALARAHLNRGDEKAGLDMLAPFLSRPQAGKYGEYVYNLYLATYLREEDWNGILDLGKKVASWTLPEGKRNELDYSLAISAENLGLADKALEVWKKLYRKKDIPVYQRAYATYFLARDAERRKDIRQAYDLNLETLHLFTQLQDERSDKAAPERVRESLAALMDVTEVADRYAESLEWAEKYADFVPQDSPDYAGLLFRRARLYRKMGDLARWRSLLEEIVSKEPDSVFGRMASSELHTQQVARDISRFAPQEKSSP